MTQIRLDNISKSFGGVEVVSGLSLTVESREFFTFVGASGCGKSTILNIIAGLEAPGRGAIYFGGEDVTRLQPRERDVAMVFQSYALYPHMSVYENIAFPLRVRKIPTQEIDTRVRQAAESLGLDGLLSRRPGALSGGQRQRVALGRAIVRKPKVFLMDEPLSNLDDRLRVEMRAEIREMHERLGVTTIYVTHDQEEAMSLSDRMAVLSDGKIQQVGKPMELYENPANLLVAGFIGAPTMNFLDWRLLNDEKPSANVKPASETDIVAGIRPHDISVGAEADGDAIIADVAMIEPTGGDVWVDGVWNGVRIRGRLAPGQTVEPGDRAHFIFSSDKILLFSRLTGVRI